MTAAIIHPTYSYNILTQIELKQNTRNSHLSVCKEANLWLLAGFAGLKAMVLMSDQRNITLYVDVMFLPKAQSFHSGLYFILRLKFLEVEIY
jgi:hypothetical protein